MIVQSWADFIIYSLQTLWQGLVGFLPGFMGALVVFIVGLIVAAGLGKIVERLIDAVRFDRLLEQLGLRRLLERADLRLHAGRFLGVLVQWFFIIVALLAASDILGLAAFSDFLRQVLLYIPNIVIAVLIMLAGVVVANFLAKVVRASVIAARFLSGPFTAWSRDSSGQYAGYGLCGDACFGGWLGLRPWRKRCRRRLAPKNARRSNKIKAI